MAFCFEKYKKTQKSMGPEKERTGHIKLDDQIALTVLLFSSEHQGQSVLSMAAGNT